MSESVSGCPIVRLVDVVTTTGIEIGRDGDQCGGTETDKQVNGRHQE